MKNWRRFIRAGFLSLILAMVSLLNLRAAEPEILLKPEYVFRERANPPRWIVSVRFWIVQDNKTNIAKRILVVTNGAPFEADTYQLVNKANNQPVILSPIPDLSSGPFISTLDLLPGAPLNNNDYELTIPANKIFFRFPGSQTNVPNREMKGTISGTNIQVNLEHGNTNTFQQRIAFFGGTPGGVSSIDLTYRSREFLNVEWLNIDFSAKADFALSSRDRKEFFNSILGGATIWYPVPCGSFYSEAGLHEKLESDQEFDLVNNLLGVHYAVFPKFRITDWMSRVFVRDAVEVPPLVILSYDYAHNIKGDESSVAADTRVDTGKADHRFAALLRWRLPIAQDYNFSFVPPLGGRYDVDVDFEVKGMYDSSAEKFLDQSWISLNFTRRSQGVKPSFSFTWARGKAGPTFEEVNALLAGVKLEF
jgi:hypothetical protein